MRPRQICLINEIPMLENFKHDLRALEALDQKRVGVVPSNHSSNVEVVAGHEAALGATCRRQCSRRRCAFWASKR